MHLLSGRGVLFGFLFLALALVFQPVPLLFAQQAAGKQFKDADMNKDGKVDAAELTIIVINITPDKFKGYDKNGDGFLDEKEFRAAGMGKEFKDVDYNRDGKVDLSEFTVIMMSISPEWFKQFDKDKSGFLNEAEYNALMQNKYVTFQ